MPTPPGNPPLLRIAGLSKSFGGFRAVDDVSLDLGQGEFLCLLGPSGCGKSTLLRLVAGFEAPSAGSITLAGRDLAGLAPHRRPVNMMFQSYALFPHMSVGRNVAYGLSGLGRAAASARVADLLRLVRLDGFEARMPDTLSGGQRQRVALARALARQPEVLLLDEPLGALDRALREETQGELRAIQKRLGTSFVVVTHDPGEAMTMADRIGVMDRGRLVQIGPPEALYARPVSRFVAGLLGDVNLIEGRVAAREPDGLVTVETTLGPIRAAACDDAPMEGAAVTVGLRPERIEVGPAGAARSEGNAISGTVTRRTYLGDRVRFEVGMADGSVLRAAADPATAIAAGEAVRLGFATGAAMVLVA